VAATSVVIIRLVRNCALERMIQYAELLDFITGAGDYWIPAFAGMTAAFLSGATLSHKRRGKVGVLVARSAHTRIGISTYSAPLLSLSCTSVGEPGSARRSTATSPSIWAAMSSR
jgi:hypothetical protein